MSMIPCSRNCGSQREGYCMLEQAGSVTNTAGGCPHYVADSKSDSASFHQNGAGLTDRTHRVDMN